jgi:hypothetical protein
METEIHEDKSQPTRTHPIEAIALVTLIIAIILYAISLIHVYAIPYGIDFGEGYLANASLELIRGHTPYHSLDQPPWIALNYPPFFLILNGFFMSLFGVSLIPGKFIATISLIGILIMAGSILRRLGTSLSIAILSAGILLCYPWPVNWSQVVRVDTLGILLGTLGIYFWLRGVKSTDAIVAGVFFSLAAFTKHSYLSAAIASIIYGFVSRDKRILTLLSATIIIIGALYLGTDFINHGWLFKHIFSYTANSYFMDRLAIGLGGYLKATWLLQIMAISTFVIPGTLDGSRKLLGWFYLFSHLTLGAYGFEGSDTNYFIEPLLSVVLLAGLTFDKLTSSIESIPAFPSNLPSPRTIGFSLILAVIFIGRFVNTGDYLIQRANAERIENGKELIRLEAGAPGDVLSEDASFTLLAGKKVLYQPYIMALLTKKRKWDQAPFIKTLEDEKYSLIVMRVDLNDPNNTEERGDVWEAAGFDRWTPEAEQAIKDHYSLYGGLDAGVGNLWYIYLANSQSK